MFCHTLHHRSAHRYLHPSPLLIAICIVLKFRKPDGASHVCLDLLTSILAVDGHLSQDFLVTPPHRSPRPGTLSRPTIPSTRVADSGWPPEIAAVTTLPTVSKSSRVRGVWLTDREPLTVVTSAVGVAAPPRLPRPGDTASRCLQSCGAVLAPAPQARHQGRGDRPGPSLTPEAPWPRAHGRVRPWTLPVHPRSWPPP